MYGTKFSEYKLKECRYCYFWYGKNRRCSQIKKTATTKQQKKLRRKMNVMNILMRGTCLALVGA